MLITRNCLLAFVLMFCVTAPTLSADPAEVVYELDIQSQPLLPASKSLSDATGLKVLFFSDVTEGVQSNRIASRYSQAGALDGMLWRAVPLESVEISESRAAGIRLKGRDGPPGKSQPAPGQMLLAQSSAANNSGGNSGGKDSGSRNPRQQSSTI